MGQEMRISGPSSVESCCASPGKLRAERRPSPALLAGLSSFPAPCPSSSSCRTGITAPSTICGAPAVSAWRVKTWGFGVAEVLFDLEIAGLENSICRLSRALEELSWSLMPPAARRRALCKPELLGSRPKKQREQNNIPGRQKRGEQSESRSCPAPVPAAARGCSHPVPERVLGSKPPLKTSGWDFVSPSWTFTPVNEGCGAAGRFGKVWFSTCGAITHPTPTRLCPRSRAQLRHPPQPSPFRSHFAAGTGLTGAQFTTCHQGHSSKAGGDLEQGRRGAESPAITTCL